MDNPPSASIHEEATVSVPAAFMSVYNNLVLFDQHVPKNSLQSIVPELATKWEWQDGYTKLVFTTREGVKWHDGKPFTAKDVGCTFDLLLSGESKLRRNPHARLVEQRREGDGRERHPGDVPSQGAAARAARPARLGLHADLCLPCAARPDAAASRSAPGRSSWPSSR